MADQRLRDDPRFRPPESLADELRQAEILTAETMSRWHSFYNVEQFLRNWAGAIEEIGSYGRYGSDEYHHDLDYRILLQKVMRAAFGNDLENVVAWLVPLVGELDEHFRHKTTTDTEHLILHSQRSNPTYWFLRRLPSDRNVIEHLEQLRPPDKT